MLTVIKVAETKHMSISESNTIVNAYTMYRHLQ